MVKNYLSKIALATLLLTGITVNAQTKWANNLGYEIANGEACLSTISKTYEPVNDALVVPATVTISGTEYPVTSIYKGKNSKDEFISIIMAGAKSFKTVVIPSSVKSIGDYAFMNAKNVTTVQLAEGVETIGAKAFFNCTGLETINFPSTIKSFGVAATFKQCSALKEAKFSEGIKTVGQNAFEQCTSLEKVYLPSSMDSISKFAFLNCSGLKEIHLAHTTTKPLCSLYSTFKCAGDDVDSYKIGDQATLYVPVDYVKDYTPDGGWYKFFKGKIVGEGTSSVSSKIATSAKVYSAEGNIIVTGATEGTALAVYSVTGQLVHKSTMTSADASLPLPVGLYLVKVGNSVFKTVNK